MSTLPIPFANHDTYPGHSGVDFGVGVGTSIPASGHGYITALTYNDRCGYGIWVYYHAIGREVGYCHLNGHSGALSKGSVVHEGTHIAYSGNTGRTTGPHLHMEVENDATTEGFWRHFDPNRVVGGGGGGGGLAPHQRRATAGGTRGRAEATTKSAEIAFLDAGEVGDFKGYVLGENIDGINGWAVGAYSGAYFWMGGLEPLTTDGLPNLTPENPLGPKQRRATAGGTNGRKSPDTSSEKVAFLDEGEVGDFAAWTQGESVQGEGRWLQGAHSGAWFWLGGLEPRSVDGLPQVTPGPAPEPEPEPEPYPQPKEPTYPDAARWGHSPSSEPRGNNKVKWFIIHHFGDAKLPSADAQWNFFMSNRGDNGVAPTWQVNADGSVFECVPPDAYRPWASGKADFNAVCVETQNTSSAPEWGISQASMEAIAHLVVWASKRYGFPIDRDHVFGDREIEAKTGIKTRATMCPGPSMDIDWIVDRAKKIAEGGSGGIVVTPEQIIAISNQAVIAADAIAEIGAILKGMVE